MTAWRGRRDIGGKDELGLIFAQYATCKALNEACRFIGGSIVYSYLDCHKKAPPHAVVLGIT